MAEISAKDGKGEFKDRQRAGNRVRIVGLDWKHGDKYVFLILLTQVREQCLAEDPREKT